MYKNHPFEIASDKLKRFKRFAECIFVKGYKRSTVYDLPRKEYQLIPNPLLEVLHLFDGKTIADVKQYFGLENAAIIDEYFNFLFDKDYVFWCPKEDLKLFPDIDLTWQTPHYITNAIIDIDNHSIHNFHHIVEQLQNFNCQHIQIRCFAKKQIVFWEKILQSTLKTVIKSIEILSSFNSNIDKKEIEILIDKHKRIRSFIVHSAPITDFYKQPNTGMGNIAFVTDKITSAKDCHIIDPAYFTVNIQLFTEAQQHHSYFNRKISIDTEGNIKNCPSLERSFGNIKDTTLEEAIEKPGFKDLWFVRKDDTRICRDCEFRYMCVDSREPFWDEEKQEWYHKVACPYDPYTATWADVSKESTVAN